MKTLAKLLAVGMILICYIAALIGIKMMGLPVPITILLVLIVVAIGGFGVIRLFSQKRLTDKKIGETSEEHVKSINASIS
jgi:hypothetical protein